MRPVHSSPVRRRPSGSTVATRRSGRRPAVALGLRVAAALALMTVLTACGAVIDTTMQVERDGSGERVMELTLSASDAKNLTGGSAAAESSISSRVPDELDYSGLRSAPDGSISATFTLAFDSTAHYVRKTESLLALGSSAAPPPQFEVADSLLVSGVLLEESFTSADLLGWLFAGLAEDGVVTGTSPSGMYEIGTTALDFGGTQYPQATGRFDADVIDSRGFSDVAVATDLTSLDTIRRTITYTASSAEMSANADLYAEYFATQVPPGAELDASGSTWTMTFTGDAPTIAAATDIALATTGSVLEIEVAPDTIDPATLVYGITDRSSCAAVCAAEAEPLVDSLTMPPGFTSSTDALDMTSMQATNVRLVPSFTSVRQRVSMGPFGGVTATTDFTVPNATAALVGTGFETLLAPPEDSGSLRTSADDTSTTYSVRIRGGSAEEFDAAYSAWTAWGSFERTDANGANPVWDRSSYAFSPGLDALVGDHGVDEAPVVEVTTPLGAWVSTGSSSGTGLTAPISFEAQGFRLGTIVPIVVLLLLGAVVAFVVVRRRDWLDARFAGLRARRNAALAGGRLTAPTTARDTTRRDAVPAAASVLSFTVPADPISTPGRLLAAPPPPLINHGVAGTLLSSAAPSPLTPTPAGSLLALRPETDAHDDRASLLDHDPSTERGA